MEGEREREREREREMFSTSKVYGSNYFAIIYLKTLK